MSERSDIVTRLRTPQSYWDGQILIGRMEEAADEIERLQAENQRLREKLLYLNDQLPINSALKPHIAHALEEVRDE